jgi:uncharacterized membrane protein YphA (DoxX/SURF4 family)
MDAQTSAGNVVQGWKVRVGWTAAVLMAILWFVTGGWKLSDLSGWQIKLTQLLVPVSLSMPATLAVAFSEVTAAVLLLVPAWRRLGACFSALLLIVFMGYIGYNYQALRGADCSCFPWLERAVGPAFFWSDGAMVALSLLAAWGSPPLGRLKQAVYAVAGVAALSAVMFAVDQSRPAVAGDLPASVQVEGGQIPLTQGPVFLYFFNPTCLHCLDAGIAMSQYRWKAVFVGIPTQDFDIGPQFLRDAGLQGVKLSPELDRLKAIFPFEDVPYAVALRDGEVLAKMPFFEEPALGEQLRKLGFVE